VRPCAHLAACTPSFFRRHTRLCYATIFDQENEIFYMDELLKQKDAEIADLKAAQKDACA